MSLVPRTRSSHGRAARVFANFGFKSGTRITALLVSLWFRSSHSSVPQGCANFGIGTLVPRTRSSHDRAARVFANFGFSHVGRHCCHHNRGPVSPRGLLPLVLVRPQ